MNRMIKTLLMVCLAIGYMACTSTDSIDSETDALQAETAATDGASEATPPASENQAKDEFADLEGENTTPPPVAEETPPPPPSDILAEPSPTPSDILAEQPAPTPAPTPESFFESKPETTVTQTPAASSLSNKVTNIKFLPNDQGGSVVIDTDQPAIFKTRSNPEQNQFVIELSDTKLPTKLKRPYNTRDFNGVIGAIDAYQNPGSSMARIVIQMREGAGEPRVQQEGNSLVVVAGEQTTSEPMAAADTNMSGGEESKVLSGSSGDDVDGTPQFYGSKISLELVDTDIRDLLKLIAREKGLNLVLADHVEGKITIKLKDIPWDQAFWLILKTKKLGYVRQGSVIRIAPLDALREESEAARKIADSRKQLEKPKTKVIPINFAQVEDIEAQLKDLILSEKGKVKGDKRTSSIIITDLPEVIERAKTLIKAIDLPPMQVLIEAKIAEVQEEFSRNVGIRWGINGTTMNMGSGNTLLRGNLNIQPLTSLTPGGGTLDIGISPIDTLGSLSTQLNFMEREGQAKVISSPRVLALHGEEATIDQMEDRPIIGNEMVDTAGNKQPTNVSYKKLNTTLTVTPFITGDNSILMKLNVTRAFAGAETDAASHAFPTHTRSVKTKIITRSGQTAVIGGIYQNDTSESEQGPPWIRKVPFLGWLFKAKSTKYNKNELLVFLTPRVISRNNPSTSTSGEGL